MHCTFTEDSPSRIIPCKAAPAPGTAGTDGVDSIRLRAAEVAHDLKNLLLGIDLLVSSALRTIPDEQPARECLEDIYGACREARDLCRVMLHDACACPMQQLSLRELLEEMQPLLRRTIPETAMFYWDPYPHPLWVTGNQSQLKRAVLNLVKNAGEALPGGCGSVTVCSGITELSELDLKAGARSSAFRPGQYVSLQVSDTGGGMDKATINGLFAQRYSTKGPDHGLGLLSVQSIVAEHRGLLELCSKPDQGTTVRILLPASSASGLSCQH